MSIKDNLENESSNGWQNIGICKKYANDNIPRKYRLTYLDIVEKSFGYGCTCTKRATTKDFAKELDMADKSFRTHIKYLEDNKHLKINTHTGFIDGGGSKPNSYSPSFPKGYGKIWLKSVKKDTDTKKGAGHYSGQL